VTPPQLLNITKSSPSIGEGRGDEAPKIPEGVRDREEVSRNIQEQGLTRFGDGIYNHSSLTRKINEGGFPQLHSPLRLRNPSHPENQTMWERKKEVGTGGIWGNGGIGGGF